MQASKDMDIQKKDILGNTDSGRKKSGTHKIWLRAAAFAMVVLLLLVAAGKICDPIRLGLQDSVSERERYLLHLLSEPEDMVDVAILGDSESYTVLSTYHLWKDAGIASYIGGQSGQWIVAIKNDILVDYDIAEAIGLHNNNLDSFQYQLSLMLAE